MSHVSHKLKNSLEGALAGGGDPATSPLYVFGPFLKLIVFAGVARVTFGASVWLVVITIAVVSAMYRLVMQWVTDGSGGSGLSEEEFGGWAAKLNAAITFIEYTLTFLVSMAAMVTFMADRFPILNQPVLAQTAFSYRTIVAILLSILTGWLVNRGPKMAARIFGPATAGVLLLLWGMVIASIIKYGFHLPDFNPAAFQLNYIHFTVGGYVRILAVMTGVEVFANLVAAYDGTAAQKSSKAFYSLLIIMGTTAITMLVVGPVIYLVANPADVHVSVFTQTMDHLLPKPLPFLGTMVGVAVLMSASAASAQGLQNLALGLRERRYLPPQLGEPNKYEVAELPVWIEVGIVCFCFILLGTHEETYLALYAAGVFILLSMTGWAVTRRLMRAARASASWRYAFLIPGTILAALLTSGATLIIFFERFWEGAWTYLLFLPSLYLVFTLFRRRYGDPTPEMDYLGQLDAAQLAGFGFGQVAKLPIMPGQPISSKHVEVAWHPDYNDERTWMRQIPDMKHIILLLDGSENAAQAIPISKVIATALNSQVVLLSAVKLREDTPAEKIQLAIRERMRYLESTIHEFAAVGIKAEPRVEIGSTSEVSEKLIRQNGYGLVITATRGARGEHTWLRGGLTHKLVENLETPVLLVQVSDKSNGMQQKFNRILVALDGSSYSERALPYARLLAKALNTKLTLLSVPAVPEAEEYRAPADIVRKIRQKAEANMQKFLAGTARLLRRDGLKVDLRVTGSIPAHAILSVAEEERADMIILTSQGRGGYNALLLGSVADHVVQNTNALVFMVPIQENPNG
ncbi:MAG TPA: universal stress protein, partial [Anaerolineales bacterium]|nr:universal stress protein [Anaerolineales bacterium]